MDYTRAKRLVNLYERETRRWNRVPPDIDRKRDIIGTLKVIIDSFERTDPLVSRASSLLEKIIQYDEERKHSPPQPTPPTGPKESYGLMVGSQSQHTQELFDRNVERYAQEHGRHKPVRLDQILEVYGAKPALKGDDLVARQGGLIIFIEPYGGMAVPYSGSVRITYINHGSPWIVKGVPCDANGIQLRNHLIQYPQDGL